MRVQNKKKVGRPKGSKDSKPRKPKQGPLLISNSRGQRISQCMRLASMPTSDFNTAVFPQPLLSSILGSAIAVSDRRLAPSPQESEHLPTCLSRPYMAGLDFLSAEGSIDAELHSWTLHRLSWIERVESYLVAVGPA